ncbi:ketose-bisphosphate aldolase [Moorella naiadis]|uniref:class II fructose-bisphosphate aldolase n=1 Tax=Moorella naiadis (nom. illeg.) TaxID=3093670 RepID=UPI003D9C7D04
MPLVTLKDLLIDADRKKYAIPAFNIDNLEIIQAILEVAEEEKAPVILSVGQGAIVNGKHEYLAAIVKLFVSRSRLPIALHLDHGKSYAQAIQCIKAGFSSVMIDGSSLPLHENITLTRKVVEASHAVGVSVEAELGKIAGTEDDLSLEERGTSLTSVAETVTFINEVPVDALAVSIGSAHGMYKGEPQLDFARLKEIDSAISVPLVLHGGSGIPDPMVREAISLGINKINVATELRLAFIKGITAAVNGQTDIYRILNAGCLEVKEIVRNKIRLFGANLKSL